MKKLNLAVLAVVLVAAALKADSTRPPRRDIWRGDGYVIYDITHRLAPGQVAWNSTMSTVVKLLGSIKKNATFNFSSIKLFTHSGTHVDAPGHIDELLYEEGYDVDSLDLVTLNGPALVVDVPQVTNITAQVMKSLCIPKNTRRVLFKTSNTHRGLMNRSTFDWSYAGFTRDGAEWLASKTKIKLVGVDYLSVAASDEIVAVHKALLEGRHDIIPVEGLRLDGVEAGAYTVHCLPLRLPNADGSPARCILVK